MMAEERRAELWHAARQLVGTRFRLHGRDPATGLDCIGLVCATYKMAGIPLGQVADDYRLRGASLAEVEAGLIAAGFRCHRQAPHTGEVALVACGHGQHHLVLIGPASHIHAHAGLRQVVETPALPGGMVGTWRLSPFCKDGHPRF